MNYLTLTHRYTDHTKQAVQDYEIRVNMDRAMYYRPYEGGTIIQLEGGIAQEVAETVEEIDKMIEETRQENANHK